MKPSAKLLIALVFSVGVLVFSSRQIRRIYEWRYPAVNTLVPSEHLAGDVGALMFGARRVAADIAYIQFLQYYGVSQRAQEEDKDHHEETGHHHESMDPSQHFLGGRYTRLQEFGRRIIRLDPFFNAPILEISGALAFNHYRISEALDLLREAIDLDPSFYRYRLYAAAILYKNTDANRQLIAVLAEAIQYPDCPVMLENVLGNLYRKYGQLKQAALVFQHILETAPYEHERETARRKLAEISTFLQP